MTASGHVSPPRFRFVFHSLHKGRTDECHLCARFYEQSLCVLRTADIKESLWRPETALIRSFPLHFCKNMVS